MPRLPDVKITQLLELDFFNWSEPSYTTPVTVAHAAPVIFIGQIWMLCVLR